MGVREGHDHAFARQGQAGEGCAEIRQRGAGDAEIKPVLGELVDLAGCGELIDLERHRGLIGADGRDQGGEGGVERGGADIAGGEALRRAAGIGVREAGQAVRLIDEQARFDQQFGAGLGEAGAAAGAVEQRRVQGGFERLDQLAEGGLGQAKLVGGLGEITGLGGGDKGAPVAEFGTHGGSQDAGGDAAPSILRSSG